MRERQARIARGYLLLLCMMLDVCGWGGVRVYRRIKLRILIGKTLHRAAACAIKTSQSIWADTGRGGCGKCVYRPEGIMLLWKRICVNWQLYRSHRKSRECMWGFLNKFCFGKSQFRFRVHKLRIGLCARKKSFPTTTKTSRMFQLSGP